MATADGNILATSTDVPALPFSIWVARQGLGEFILISTEAAALGWMAGHPNGRIWKVDLVDPVEFEYIRPVEGSLKEKPRNRR